LSIDDFRLRLTIVDWMVLITNPQSVIPESQSAIANLNRQSPIAKSAITNRKSAIV